MTGLDWTGAINEEFVAVKPVNLTDIIAGIRYSIESALAKMVTPCPADSTLFCDSHMTAIMQAKVDQTGTAKSGYVNYEIRLRQTIDDIVWSLRFIVNLLRALLETDNYLAPATQVFTKDADSVAKSARNERNESKESPGPPGG